MRRVQRVQHTEEQIGWIGELFRSQEALFMAKHAEIEVIEHGGRSQTVLREFNGKPNVVFIRHSPAALQSRCTVLHEFAHYYALSKWPELTPPKTPEMVCEAAAFVPHWRALAGRENMWWVEDILEYFRLNMQDPRLWVNAAGLLARHYERSYPHSTVEDVIEKLLLHETP